MFSFKSFLQIFCLLDFDKMLWWKKKFIYQVKNSYITLIQYDREQALHNCSIEFRVCATYEPALSTQELSEISFLTKFSPTQGIEQST